MKKLLSLMLSVTLGVALLAGCGTSTSTSGSAQTSTSTAAATTSASKPATILWMNNSGEESEIKWQDEMVKQFMAQNPTIKVEIQRMSFDNYVTNLQTKIASGDAPDIFATEGDQMKTFQKNGYLMDLSKEAFISNYVADYLPLVTIDGQVVATPNGPSSMFATYNKDAFKAAGIEKVPETLDEFYADLDKLQKAGIAPIANGYKETWCLMADMQTDYVTSVLAKDPNAIIDLLSREKKWVDSAAWRDEFTRVAKRFTYSSSDPFGTDWSGAGDLVANGKAGMVLNGFWAISGLRGKNESVNLGVFAVPVSNNAADTKLMLQPPNGGTAVYSGTKNKEATLKFMEFMARPESGTAFAKTANKISSIKGAEAPSDPAWKDVFNYTESGKTFNLGAMDINFPNEYRVAVETLVSKFLLTKDKNVDTLLKDLDSAFDKIAADKK